MYNESITSGSMMGWSESQQVPMQKSAAWIGKFLTAAGRGFGSHTASLLGGNLGTGGLLKLIGRLLGGGHTYTVRNKAGQLVKKLYSMRQLQRRGNVGFFSGLGQRISLAGDDLTRWTNKLHKNYMSSIDDLTGSHTNWKGRAVRFGLIGPGALAAPMLYSSWAEDPKNKDKVLAQPAKALKAVWDYGSVPGLIATGVEKGSDWYSKSMQRATMDGAAIASKLINYELANQPRVSYLAGVANPAYFANKTDAAVQNYLQQLNQMQFN